MAPLRLLNQRSMMAEPVMTFKVRLPSTAGVERALATNA
jgi:hypothetical protein